MNGDLPKRSVGTYEIVEELAHGGMATVFRALQPSLGRFVALKVLSTELSRDPDYVSRFQREAHVAARLEHPNIVPIYDVGNAGGAFYIAMRLVPGRSLSDIITRDGPLPLERARVILAQIASALDYAHRQGVVHRDVKPSNVLVEADDQVSLVDFGIARAADATQITRFGVVVGTPTFMAPEQAQGIEVDFRADLYSLGVVAYLMLTGRAPFEADSVVTVLHKHVYDPPPSARVIRPDLPESVDAALTRMLAKQPGERYPTAAAFVTALHTQPAPEVRLDASRIQPEVTAPAVEPTAISARQLKTAPQNRLPLRRVALAAAGVLGIVLLSGLVLLAGQNTSILGVVPLPNSASSEIANNGERVAATPTAPPQLAGTWEVLAGDPTSPGTFNGPAAVAVDQQGNIFVAEQLNHRVQKLSSTGQPIAQWGTYGEGPGQFREPSGVAVDTSGNLYIADRGNSRIQKLGADGHVLAQWGGPGQLTSPAAVALDSQGNVYVADSGSSRIQKFSATGQALQQWGVFGEGPGQFSTPTGIAVDAQGDMYVVDQGNARIQKLAADGQALAQWGSGTEVGTPTPGQLTLSTPTSIVLDSAGNLLVTDSGANRIVKLSPIGSEVATWGEWGGGPGEFEYPLGIATDAQGSILIADHDNDRVQKLSADGKPLTQWGSERTRPEEFRQPTGVAVDAQGNVYVVDKNNQRVQKLSPSGQPLAQWGAQGDAPGQFSVPMGVAIDTQGNVLVCDAGSVRVQRFAADGRLLAFWGTRGEAAGQLQQPTGIATDVQGNVYITDSEANRLLKFSSSGQPITQWGATGSRPGELQSPAGIAVAQDGSVFVADQGNSRIQKFSSTGQFLKQWGVNGSDHGQFLQVAGLALDARGNVLVADTGNNRVYEFSPDGQLLAESGTRGMQAGEFQGPVGIATDSGGAIYVSELWNHRLQRLRPEP